jgi:hypothetical protein
MADFTNLSEERILDWWGNVGSPTRPTSHYAALSTATWNEDGTSGAELSGSGYARQSITWTRSAQTLNPTATITFGPASGSWGTVTHFGIFDASSAGNLLAFEALTSSKAIGNGDSASFATSNLSVTLD